MPDHPTHLSASERRRRRSSPGWIFPGFCGLALAILLAGLTDTGLADPPPSDEPSPLASVLTAVLDEPASFEEIPFARLVHQATGRRVIPVDPDHPADRATIDALDKALDQVLRRLGRKDSPVRDIGRINEVSRLFEEELVRQLNALDSFECATPRTEDGRTLRSGYPDLRLEHLPSGRVTYLDPKLFAADSRASSFRSFYFEPKTETNKITEDARHLIIGIEHDGNTGAWQFPNWSLVDLSALKVRLKLEFQASNAGLYREETTIRRGRPDEASSH